MSLPRPTLETPRTIVRLPTHRDVPAIVAYLEDNVAHLSPFDPTWPREYCAQSYWERRVLRCFDEFDQGVAARFFIFDRTIPRLVLGTVSLSQIFRGPFHACYLGYALAASAQGKGLMHEALTRVIPYAFHDLHLHRIMANYMPHNVRSGRLLRRLGFVVEGYARDYLRIAGNWEDHILTSMTNPNWQDEPV